jgi:hypothetical protein
MLKVPTEYERDTSSVEFKNVSCQLPDSLLGVSCDQRVLEDESRIMRTQMGTRNRSENGRSTWGALYDTTPAVTFNQYVNIRPENI